MTFYIVAKIFGEYKRLPSFPDFTDLSLALEQAALGNAVFERNGLEGKYVVKCKQAA